MAVNVASWNEQFAALAESIGLTEAEAEAVFVRGPYGEIDARFKALLAKIADSDPERHARIRRLLELKMEEVSKLQM